MARRIPTQAELDARPDRVAARRLIAAYQSEGIDSAGIVDQLCFQTRPWVVWYEIFGAVCRVSADVQCLATLSIAILRSAAATETHEEEDSANSHLSKMLMQSRESWDGKCAVTLFISYGMQLLIRKSAFFSDGEPAWHAERQNLLAFLGRMSMARVTACQIYFIGRFRRILEPQALRAYDEVAIEDLIMIEDYFTITGIWMKSQFDVVPDTREVWQESMTYTEKRWERWKRNLRALAEQSDETRRAKITDIFLVMA